MQHLQKIRSRKAEQRLCVAVINVTKDVQDRITSRYPQGKIQFAVLVTIILLIGTVNQHTASNVFFLETAYCIPDISEGERGLMSCALGYRDCSLSDQKCISQAKLHLKQITSASQALLGQDQFTPVKDIAGYLQSSELLPATGAPDSHSPKCQIDILKQKQYLTNYSN